MHETSNTGHVCEDCAYDMISVRCPECEEDNDFFGKCHEDVFDCQNCDEVFDWEGEKVPEEKKRKRDDEREATQEAAKQQADAKRELLKADAELLKADAELLKADAELLKGIKSEAQSSVLKALIEDFVKKHG